MFIAEIAPGCDGAGQLDGVEIGRLVLLAQVGNLDDLEAEGMEDMVILRGCQRGEISPMP